MGRWLFVTLILAVTVAAWPAGRAAAAIDISGDWELELLHPDIVGAIACTAMISQVGTNLSAPMTCDSLGSGTLIGTIDVDIGTFNLSGNLGPNPVNFAGQSAMDGNSASGFWVVSPVPGNGTFSGTRTVAGGGVGGIAELAPAPAPASNDIEASPDGSPVAGLLLLAGAFTAVAAIAVTAVRRRI